MLGERDVIGLDVREPGTRLPSMMTPTLVLDDDGDRGSSPGARAPCASRARSSSRRRRGRTRASRRRGDRTAAAAGRRDRPRRGRLAEVVAAGLADDGYDVRAWADRNLFFGGVSAVERRPNGLLGAAGDPRRGGHGVVAR